jgi:hypothetical protein
MAKAKYQATIQAAVPKAGRTEIDKAFIRLATHWQVSSWLGLRNRYRTHCIAVIDKDLKAKRKPKARDMAEYIAASVPLHTYDGWAYLGRAIDAHIRGDTWAARHLAYYAELRAAMAILAHQGIGVFNLHSYVVESPLSLHRVDVPTHDMARLALESWARIPDSASLLLAVIQPGGQPLDTWFGGSTMGSAFTPVGERLLEDWGYDLRMDTDRDARNVASYRPSAIERRQNPTPTVAERYKFLRAVWEAFEPGTAPFHKLDQHLLRISLERMFKATKGRTHRQSPAEFSRLVAETVKNVPASNIGADLLTKFLLRQTEPADLQLISSARPTGAVDHIQVISRAALLLRIAAGATGDLIGRTRTQVAQLRFWWHPRGEMLGLWQGAEPASRADFYATWYDVQAALQDFELWLNSPPSEPVDLLRQPFSILGTTERIALWSVA